MSDAEHGADDRTNPFLAKGVGNADQGSKAKAKTASDRTQDQQTLVDSEAWPRGVDGKPMMKLVMTASELIPTGQYANVSIGPCQITAFVDPDRMLREDEAYFDTEQRHAIAKALNELAEIVEVDVVAVQRNLVMESMQNQISSK